MLGAAPLVSNGAAAATLEDLCAKAMGLQLSGRPDLAEPLYRTILRQEPRHAAANYCVGMLHVQRHRPSDAVPHLLVAVEECPTKADYWLGYLEGLLASGRSGEAAQTLALARQHGLAGAASEDFARRLEHSAPHREAVLLEAIKARDFAAAGIIARGLTEEFPERGLAWKIHGALLWAENQPLPALAALQTAAHLLPQDPEAFSNLGLTLAKLNRFPEAERSLQHALELDPLFATAHYRLGMAYEMQGRYALAEASHRTAIALNSQYVQGDNALGASNLLFMLSHNAGISADELFAEHCRFGEVFEAPLRASWPRHTNSPDPDRILRIGLVSGDLRQHAVATFIEPVLAILQTDPSMELSAYFTHATEDAASRRLRGYFKQWHSVFPLTDGELAEKIRDDGIDILFDLSGHTYMNRLLVFARKPSPIQVSWIGYPGTTGLRAMDYYLAGRHFLTPGVFDRHFTERLVYFPANVSFQPHPGAPAVRPLPALEAGYITFGSFNRVGKINDATIALWSELLKALPTARMIIGGLAAGGADRSLLDRFAAVGVASHRLTLHARTDMDSYLALHHQIDLCLDATPYTGGTTTNHALWMGVPTLTIAGATPASRSCAAFLDYVGLDAFIATGVADFVRRGTYWAAHLQELAQLRAGLRSRWERSSTPQNELIAGALAYAMRRMWTLWCGGSPPESFEITESQSLPGGHHGSRQG